MSDQQEIARIQEQIKTLFAGQERLEKNQYDFESEMRNTTGEIYREIKALKEDFANRLPTWATIIISILTASLGACLGCLLK
jgi:hypothetical protein